MMLNNGKNILNQQLVEDIYIKGFETGGNLCKIFAN